MDFFKRSEKDIENGQEAAAEVTQTMEQAAQEAPAHDVYEEVAQTPVEPAEVSPDAEKKEEPAFDPAEYYTEPARHEEYVILVDRGADIDRTAPGAEEIGCIPMEYSYMDQMRTSDTQEDKVFLHLFYEGQRDGALTKTSQVSPFTYREVFNRYLEEGKSVLYIALSSGLSATFDSACMTGRQAEKDYPGCRVCVVDSLSASGGIGVLAERALRNRKKGMSLEENYADIQEAAHHVCLWLAVQDLSYLKRGGRLSGSSAAFGTLLRVSPLLKINGKGKLEAITNKRGRKAVVSGMQQFFEGAYKADSRDVIYLSDADNEELAAQVESAIRVQYPSAVIRRVGLSPIIGAHTGPDAVLLCHMGK